MAETSDKFFKTAPLWAGTVGSGGVADGSTTTITLSSSTGLVNGEVYAITIDRIDGSGASTPSAREVVIGKVSGSDLVDCIRGVEGTAQSHVAGAIVECLWTAAQVNKITEGFLTEHVGSGGHDVASMITNGVVLDEDDMVSNSDTKLVTQQSVKAYVDAQAGTSAINVVISGGENVVMAGVALDVIVPFDCEITSATALAKESGTLQVDIWKGTYASYPPTDANSITASAPVKIIGWYKTQDTTLSGWTKTISANDILRFNVDGVTLITQATITLNVTKT